MSFLGRAEADSTGYPRTADLNLAPAVLDAYRVPLVDLSPTGTGLKHEASVKD
jgi:hypothetical protein